MWTKQYFSWLLLVLLCAIAVLFSLKYSGPLWMGSGEGLVIAEARFFQDGLGLGNWNPYWFMGIPGNHVGSPAVPWLLSVLGKLFNFSLGGYFIILRVLSGLGILFSLLFFLLLVEKLQCYGKFSGKQRIQNAFLSGLLGFFLPSLLTFSPGLVGKMKELGFPSSWFFLTYYFGDSLSTIAYPIILLCCYLIWQLIFNWDIKKAAFVSALVGLLMLVNMGSVATLFFWIVVMVISSRFLSRKTVTLAKLILRLILVILVGMALASFWFTPYYWLTIIGSPSLGGKPFYQVVVNLIQSSLRFLPVVLGVVVAKKFLKKKHPLLVIGFTGMLVFGSITLMKVFADPDYWLDYSRYGRELDMSLAMFAVGWIREKQNFKAGKTMFLIGIVVLIVILSRCYWFFSKSIKLEDTVEYQVANDIGRNLKEECSNQESCSARVFTSGSSTFWLNAFYPISQVRGGYEMGSVNDWWPHGAYQIREGREANLSQLWLEAMGVFCLLVHDETSREVFHDFGYPQKFADLENWKKVEDANGDSIYCLEGSGLARLASKNFLELVSPRKGDDEASLLRYVGYLGDNVKFTWKGKNRFFVEGKIRRDEVIRLAVSYTPFWRVLTSSSPVDIRKDPLGLLVIVPEKGQEDLSLEVEFYPLVDEIGGLMISLFSFIALIKHKNIFSVHLRSSFGL
jgi:hypothetical protein